MKSRVFKKSVFSSARAVFAGSIFTVTAVVMVLYGLQQAERASIAEGRRILEEGLRRAVVTCYAVEGKYPESLSHVEKNYGVRVDRAKYTVFYEIEASNVFPVITVIESGEGF